MLPDILSYPAPLQKRIRQYWPDFIENYMRVYPQAGAIDIQLLIDTVAAAYKERSASMRKTDEARARREDWFQQPQQVGMMLYVHLFSGDLKKLAHHIDYFKELGVTYLHLMPLLQPRQGPNDGGYAVADYRNTDPRLGTMTDLRALAALLRKEGILLVVDMVMNHTAREHAWAQAALRGEAHYQAYYWMFDDRSLPDAYERTLPEVFPDFAPGNFTWQPEIEKWVWTTFYNFQWDLNFSNPDVFAAMLGEMLFVANCGVDVLRLDAVPF
ncbi:MAG TPA: alpha-amylase family glycosyl hydrolase, partial [Saprospiraceae bacterium]|nr:alpha-amylase family glycosyl hydrolase [Saprospiraceae bacterium]